MLDLYSLLPQIYHIMDDHGDLEDFLGALQAKLEEIHEDEEGLRLIQGIFTTPLRHLKLIARSLGWKLQSTTAHGQRHECATIVDYYDLKGTPYGIRLVSKLTLDKFFNRLIELYAPTGDSASEICETASTDLATLLANGGTFVNPEDWDPSEGGCGYGYDARYSYIVFVRVKPEQYTYGELKPRTDAFKALIHTMHPAGRYCYPFIVCQATTEAHHSKVQDCYDEITGKKHWDSLKTFDAGKTWDESDEPIDPSASTILRLNAETFDEASRTWDETEGDPPAWKKWDMGLWEVLGLFEIS